MEKLNFVSGYTVIVRKSVISKNVYADIVNKNNESRHHTCIENNSGHSFPIVNNRFKKEIKSFTITTGLTRKSVLTSRKRNKVSFMAIQSLLLDMQLQK